MLFGYIYSRSYPLEGEKVFSTLNLIVYLGANQPGTHSEGANSQPFNPSAGEFS